MNSACAQCGRPLRFERWKAKYGKGKYCSVNCRNIARQNRVTIVCPGCEKSFAVIASTAHRRKFCSSKCAKPNFDDQRFECSIERTPTCWNWIGTIGHNGYGRFTPHATHRGRMAHRVAYEKWVGPILSGLHIDHLCGNRKCVNPAHLEAVTPAVNVQRALKGKTWAEIGRSSYSKQTVIRIRRTA